MKTRKLACQGCGADVDPVEGQKYIDCLYCGTTNVLVIGLKKGRGKGWEYQLPGRARRFGGSQPVIGMHGDNAAVAHGGGRRSRTPTTVTLLSITTGKSKWARKLSGSSSVRGVVVTASRVFVRQGSWIQILDVATGKPPKTGTLPAAGLPAP